MHMHYPFECGSDRYCGIEENEWSVSFLRLIYLLKERKYMPLVNINIVKVITFTIAQFCIAYNSLFNEGSHEAKIIILIYL